MDYKRIARNATITLLAVQALSSFGNSVMATVNTIVGARLSGSDALAGLPGALLQVGAAVSSLLLGLTMDRFGRRLSLAAGMAIGILGALAGAVALVNGSFVAFLAGLALVGFTRSTSLMGRFVAAEVTPPEQRGRAISYVILGGTFGSVLGPYLADPSGRLAEALRLDSFAGPYGVALLTFSLASAAIFLFLRPEPRDIGRDIARLHPETAAHSGPTRSILEIFRTRAAFVAVAAMVFAQVVMVGLMGITSLHMVSNNLQLADISIVFSSHTFGMFAFSILTGQLLDRWGRGPVILVGAAMLFAASVMAPLRLEVLAIAFALFLLGLGWNFCFIGGSTLLADILTPDERARTQGVNELSISLMTAISSFGSGLVFAAWGYAAVGMVGAVVSIFPFALTGWWVLRRPLPAAT